MQTRKGSALLSHSTPAPADSTVPARLRAAGAIVVGKSTLPEFAIEGFTANLVDGVTRNPWNTAMSPGGSSGGSAVAIASGRENNGFVADDGLDHPRHMCVGTGPGTCSGAEHDVVHGGESTSAGGRVRGRRERHILGGRPGRAGL
jgi:hypothetical protein